MPPNDQTHVAWPQVKALFERALDCAPPEREALLAAAGVAETVRAEVRSLLAHHAESTGEQGFLFDSPSARHAAPPSRAGERFGAWQIVRLLGAGGMGDVFEARRADQSFEGRAAIKLLKRGMDSEGVLRRFAQERQALARLNHPNIARLFDAGLSPDGLPYFVMEYVDGLTIDAAAWARPLEQRLALFLQLADAVSHAHRNLLVHGDLKPGNVLVTGDGQVKLLDFGIAKALEPDRPHATGDITLGAPRPFTPNYASPEQIRGEAVGTGTDIYSLGVLLYLMLTGARPYGRSAATPQDAARAVLEEEPSRPSTLLANPTADAHWLRNRRRLAGDLDNILLKTLEKRVEARYATVDALAADIRAFRDGYPVTAHAPRVSYLAAKFMRRHRPAVIVGVVALFGLLGALGAAGWQAQQAEAARQLAERRFTQVRQLATSLVFRYHDGIVNLPGTLALREALLSDAVATLDSIVAEGSVEPTLARELAETYFRVAVLQGEQYSPSQGRLDDAQRNLDKAIALLPRYIAHPVAHPVAQPDLAPAALNGAVDIWLAHSALQARRGQLSHARQALEQAQALAERALAAAPHDLQGLSRVATIQGHLGMIVGGSGASANLGRAREAVAYFERAREHFAKLVQREPGNPEWMHQQAWGLHLSLQSQVLLGQTAQAVASSVHLISLRDRAAALQPDNAHFRHQTAMARLASAAALSAAGEHERALAYVDAGETIIRGILRGEPGNKTARRDSTILTFVRGRLLWAGGREAQARPLLARALSELPVATELREDFYMARWRAEALIVSARAWVGADAAKAQGFAREAAELMRAHAGVAENAPCHWGLALALGEQAAALAALGRGDDAASHAKQALEQWRLGSPEGEPPASYARWLARDRALAGV